MDARNPGANATRRMDTDFNGRFRFANLPPGDYEVSVAKEGFRTLRKGIVHVDPDTVAQLQLTMQVGPVSENVDVTDEGGSLAGESLAAIDSILTFDEIMHLVQDERTVTDLAYLIAGVNRKARGGLGSGFVVGGARADNTNFIVDGFSNYDARSGGQQSPPNYDAVQEFRVQTTGSAAEYGHMAGGVMNVILRNGTNRLQGSAFEIYRPGALAARNFFDIAKSYLLRNQFGVTLSGPVAVPHIYSGRDKTFFLLSWESLHQSSGENRLTEVPSALERTGDFSASRDSAGRPVTVVDPLSRQPFPSNRIPVNRLDPLANQIQAYYPRSNAGDPADNYHADQVNRTHYESVLFKVEEHASEKDTLSFRYMTRPNAVASPYSGSDLGVFGSNTKIRPTLAGGNYTRIFNPSVANELRIGLNRMADHELSIYAGQDFNSRLGLPPVSDPHQFGFPRINVLNLAAVGDSATMPIDFTENSYEAADSVTYAKGHHILKAGTDVLRTQYFQRFYNNTRGSYNFLGRWTGVPFADFLLGDLDSTSRQTTTAPAYWFYTDWGAFVQDQYEVNSRLTLNLGLRYEMMRPPYEKYGRSSSFVRSIGELVLADDRTVPNLAQQMAAAGLKGLVTTASQAGIPPSLMYPNDHNMAPRFGFAYQASRSSATVIRGGYGIYYADSLVNPVFNDLSDVYPFNISQTFNRVSSNPSALTLSNPFPANLAALPGVTNVHGFNLHPKAQYLQSYMLSLDRQLDSLTTLEVEFDGSRGSHLEREYDFNQPFHMDGTSVRPYRSFGTIAFYDFGSNSVYNAGVVTLRRAYRHGIFYGASYVFAKSLDDASQGSGNSQGDYPGAQDSRDLAAERGRSDWDTGHSAYVFGSYAAPLRRLAIVRNWLISVTGRFYTGQPFTPRVSNVNLSLGEATRPDRVAKGAVAAPGVNGWFDQSAFPLVPNGVFRFGNSGRNILDGPGSVTVNAALTRVFRFRDQRTLQLRMEAVNLVNRANFGLPVNFVDSQNAGKILTADPGRVVQIMVRYQF